MRENDKNVYIHNAHTRDCCNNIYRVRSDTTPEIGLFQSLSFGHQLGGSGYVYSCVPFCWLFCRVSVLSNAVWFLERNSSWCSYACVTIQKYPADHFVCREAHGLPLSAFTDFEGDDRVEQTMRNMAYPTKTHLSWRFRQWYKNRRLLSAIAGPPFREILDQMKATTQLADDQKRPFTLYACHDITILGLLYGLGADFLADDRGTGWMWWPPYASTLALELVRCKDDDHDPFRVRVLLDGTPIRSVDFADPDFSSMASTRDDLLRIADFERVVERLEEDGGSAARL